MSDISSSVISQYFGFSSFKEGQKEVIEKILAREDVIAVMPTGSGKSVCYQVPAIIFPGTTIVVSPLISLMKDQVDALSQNAVPAAFLNSSLTNEEFSNVIKQTREGKYKLIYLAPERMELQSFRNLVTELDVSFLAVDEAHCISQWGHNFRPSYLKVAEMIEVLPKRPPVSAFTATATPQVVSDIAELLSLKKPFIHITGFDRENLYFEVSQPQSKLKKTIDILRENKSGSAIVYCSTRKNVEKITERLKENGIKATRYHGGLDDAERINNQEDFLYDRAEVIVATNAFGMGIDKSNIRLVIHYNMPKTMEHYYQEAGRAGRDGEPARCILLYSASDIVTNRFLIENDGENNVKERDYQKLQHIIDYCNITGCLRQYILNYFGESDALPECNNCGNCLNQTEKSDVTEEAQKILSCIFRTRERFGSNMIIDVLRGSRGEKLLSMQFNKLSTYGIMDSYPKYVIRDIISFLIAENFIIVKGGEYPVLTLSPKAYKWLKKDSSGKLFMKKIIHKKVKKDSEKVIKKGLTLEDSSLDLFEELRLLRLNISREQRVPPFVIFSDATLKDMCVKMPRNDDEMLAVNGVGNHKLNKYGKKFLDVIESHALNNS